MFTSAPPITPTHHPNETRREFFNISTSVDPETSESFYDYTEGSDVHTLYETFRDDNVKRFMVRQREALQTITTNPNTSIPHNFTQVAAPLIECSFEDPEYLL